MHLSDELPISQCLGEIVDAVANSTPVVLKAPPGAGKTTGVPPALQAARAGGEGQTLLVQPRRLAARAAASRIARLTGCRVGDDVGYHVRFDRRAGNRTRLLAMTTGILLRRLQSDPLLQDVSCVILDEFHERRLEGDLALGMLQRIRTTLRPELKVIVMSATLDPAPITSFLGDAVSIVSEGRSFPVDIRYVDRLSRDSIEQKVVGTVAEALSATSGDLLVFLPGVGEIRRTERAIDQACVANECDLFQLYGDLSPNDQEAVLSPSSRRKIILSTNVAETSITIPGVTGVIDSGLARVMRYEPNVGLSALRVEPISQASADQRAGRAGRTEPGVCWRLWPAAAHRSRRQLDPPEIALADFAGAMLMLAAWGEREVTEFPWLTPPPEPSVDAAKQLLIRLDAIGEDGSLTEIGKQMLTLPVHPRVARFMIAANQMDVTGDAALVAALLTEKNPFRSPDAGESTRGNQVSTDQAVTGDSDVIDRVERLKAYDRGDGRTPIQAAAARQVLRVAKQLGRAVESLSDTLASNNLASDGEFSKDDKDVRLRRALLAAYPDRVAKRRQAGSDRGLMVGGKGVRLDRRSVVRSSELLVCVDVDGKGTEATVRSASAIDRTWLDRRLLREVDEPFFHDGTQAVVNRRRVYFDDLLLSEAPIECEPGGAVADLLADHARREMDRWFPRDDYELGNFIRRVRFLSDHMPELDLPELDQQTIDDVLQQLCQARTSLAQLAAAPWLDHLRGRFDYEQLRLIDQHAPARITVPSGNSIRLQYVDGKPPIMGVRLQELFGWKTTPTVAGGRVAVLLHLLGPNHRPQQVTDDLESFWSQTYSQVRKDLRRRYPKHHWPEDPLTATATRNALKPKTSS